MRMESSDAQCITPPDSVVNSRFSSSGSAVDMSTQDSCSPETSSSREPLTTTNTSKPNDTVESTEPPAQAKDSEEEGQPDEGSAVASKSRKRKRPVEPVDDAPSDCEPLFDMDRCRSITALEREGIGLRYFVGVDSTLPQRRAKAARRLTQAKAYAELVEDRIQDLEKRIREFTNEKTPLVHEKASLGGLAEPLLHVAPMRWSEFHRRAAFNFSPKTYAGEWQHRPERDDERRPVIEVLTEEPRYGAFPNELNTTGRLGRHVTMTEGGCDTSTQGPAREPYQIRIRSKPLLKLLKDITGCGVLVGPHQHRLLMVRPFKLLTHFAANIQKHAKDVVTQGEVTRPETELQSDAVLKQLGKLASMMNEYLSRPLSLQQGVSYDIKRVSFNELWYFFKPGDEVRTPGEDQIQLYRIAKVTGGRDLVQQRDEDRNIHDHDPAHASKKLKDQGYSEGAFIIECFYIHYDSTRFGPVNATFQIRKFDGERDIDQLPVIPLKCYYKEHEIRDKLLTRGQRFIELANPAGDPAKRAHRRYVGPTADKNPEQVESEVIVDFELAFLQSKIDKPAIGLQDRLVSDDQRELRDDPKMMHPMCDQAGCCANDATFRDYEVDELERNEFRNKHRILFDANYEDAGHLQPDHKRLLPPHVFGFVLRTRRWATFDITRLEDIPPNAKGWESLVIEPSIKRTVLALVKSHERLSSAPSTANGSGGGGTQAPADLIPGKGAGLIILLHGEPGVGKTSTAECVAALTGRPLFPITCGDIGDKAETVETNLEKNFQLAHKWGCVLLLDEADIFLSARTERDIQRNAIVSVFLRTLEYYSGILFLTTNRVGTIDRAFKSRIHCSLLYKKLDKKRTKAIWQNNIARIKEKLDIRCDEDGILAFAMKHYKQLKRTEGLIVWNGRQIRNAFQTSIALATYDNQDGKQNKDTNPQGQQSNSAPVVTLDASHFERVAEDARQFDKYLKQASTFTDAEYAFSQRERRDEYESSGGEEADTERRRKRGGGKKRTDKRGSGSGKKGVRGNRNRKRRRSLSSLSTDDPDPDSGTGSDESNRGSDTGASSEDDDGTMKNARSSSSETSSEDDNVKKRAKKKEQRHVK